jgi:hypothetical protein
MTSNNNNDQQQELKKERLAEYQRSMKELDKS